MQYPESDLGLAPFREIMEERAGHLALIRSPRADWHERYGLHRTDGGWRFRECLPNVTDAWLVGDFSRWERCNKFRLSRDGDDFAIELPAGAIKHGQQYRLYIKYKGGEGERLPSAVRTVARSEMDGNNVFNALVWEPASKYIFRAPRPAVKPPLLIYEAHIGMAQEREGVGTFREFQANVLPHIAESGYNTIQLMGIMEHPYYASFGYQVSNFFAVNERFGTPEDFKCLVDAAHEQGICVTMDLIHSHAAANTVEGIAELDGTSSLFFHDGERGHHPAWGSCCFDYSKARTLEFLLSNCRFWLEEYNLDGFRFDGVTSMLYLDHGLNHESWSYGDYFSPNVDWDAFAYLTFANELIHSLVPTAFTSAEEVSGFPGLTVSRKQFGCGFDYRLAMGVTDFWFKLADMRDEDWPMGKLWHELTAKRTEEKCISYVECHDQALVGGQTLFFRLAGERVYSSMGKTTQSMAVDRAMALHKMSRLATFASADKGYLNFMGNEFGHPDWIDFPTERNGWSYRYARRQWHLMTDKTLKYHFLADFDKVMLNSFDGDFFDSTPFRIMIDEHLKLLVFHRTEHLFIFNFHPTNSYENLPVIVRPGEYRLLMDTDEVRFGGFARIQPAQSFFSRPILNKNRLDHFIHVYIPSRTAIVLKRKN